jgi:aminotransferase in exopolysaccharide biosynthesis
MKILFTSLVKDIYESDFVPLHRPIFAGNEKQYLVDCIDSNFVSSVGEKVTEFERKIAEVTGSRFAVATVNGTSALHTCLHLGGVSNDDEVITQSLTFVATCNAISYCGASPVFIDVDIDTLGMSPLALEDFLKKFCEIRDGYTFNKQSGKRIKACVPMHTFGFPCRIVEISSICKKWNIALVEDAAESLGSYFENRHTGTFGRLAAISFNGNKIITTGGGGMIITDDKDLAKRAKHLTTTAKVPHAYEFVHDDVGYNYRMPNLNAALGCAQLEKLGWMLEQKKEIAHRYAEFFEDLGIKLLKPIENANPNNWLNAIILNSKTERDDFLSFTNENGVMTRPVWRLLSDLKMFRGFQTDGLKNSKWIEARVVNLPSSVPN